MASTVARGFTHKQDVAATSWVIAHGELLGKSSVDVFVEISGELVKMIPKTVASSGNTITVTFSTAYKGEAYVI